ncbi:hypothetical protein B0H17DRAFT_1147878 [Mycena rosella]|uniref:Uncharacterized protein n=1 Tax=Mycena rosella TaxID=1033263 RepID=A0AAD7CH91_MYCRO|nr:hypothetical protein B0H17DRAFT_1147878 [Mycena rosella]
MEFRVSSSDLRFNRRWCFSNIKVRMVSGFNWERCNEIVSLPPEKTRSTATAEPGEVAFFQKKPGSRDPYELPKGQYYEPKEKQERVKLKDNRFPADSVERFWKVQVSQPSGMGLGPALPSKYLAPKELPDGEFPDGGNHRDFSSRARDTSAPSPEISPLQGDLRSVYVPYTAVTIRVHTVPFTTATVTVRWATGGLTVRYTDPYNP